MHSHTSQNRRVLLLLAAVSLVGFGHVPAGFGQEAAQRADAQVERMSVASGHHELALLYVKKGDYDAAVTEARKILQLRFPQEHEHLVVQSLSIIADKLGESRRFDLGQALLDDTFRSAELVTNRVKTLLAKARLYKQAGDDTRAIESYRRAVDLGGTAVRGTAR